MSRRVNLHRKADKPAKPFLDLKFTELPLSAWVDRIHLKPELSEAMNYGHLCLAGLTDLDKRQLSGFSRIINAVATSPLTSMQTTPEIRARHAAWQEFNLLMQLMSLDGRIPIQSPHRYYWGGRNSPDARNPNIIQQQIRELSTSRLVPDFPTAVYQAELDRISHISGFNPSSIKR